MTRAQFIALIIAAYLMTDQDKDDLVALLLAAQLDAMSRAYRRGQSTVGAAPTWTPTKAQEAQARADAERDAQSIVDTYQRELTNAAEAVTGAWLATHDSLDGAMPTVTKAMGVWSDERATWKAPQVANYTAGVGNYDGTGAFVGDLLSGDVIDELTGDVVDSADYSIACTPDGSSNDVCATVAGFLFDIADWDTLPELPNHSSCPHTYEIVSV